MSLVSDAASFSVLFMWFQSYVGGIQYVSNEACRWGIKSSDWQHSTLKKVQTKSQQVEQNHMARRETVEREGVNWAEIIGTFGSYTTPQLVIFQHTSTVF